MSQHTEGEWHVNRSVGTDNDWIVDEQGKAIALMYSESGNVKANAHLITAAPELYVACQHALIALDNIEVQTGELTQQEVLLKKEIEAAIAKAEGKE